MTCVIHCYAVLAIVSNSYPPLQGRLPTRYSPVRNSSKKSKLLSSAFYLHVLGTPPAFVLSQDQTLINTLIIVRALTHYRRLTIYSCKLTGYNVFYHNPALGFLFSSQRSLSLLRQLLYSSKSRMTCQHFFWSFFASRVRYLSRNSLFIISSLACLVNNFFKVLEPFQVCGKSVKTTFISYHANQYLSIGFSKKIKQYNHVLLNKLFKNFFYLTCNHTFL